MKIIPKLHFLASLAMFAFIAMMVVESDVGTRAMLLLPIVVCYAASRILFSMDQADMVKGILERNK